MRRVIFSSCFDGGRADIERAAARISALLTLSLRTFYYLFRASFASHAQPFPIVVADSLASRTNGSAATEAGDIVPLTNPIYEFTACERADVAALGLLG